MALEKYCKGKYTSGNPLYIEESFLTGKTNETGQSIIFIPEINKQVGSYNTVLFVAISAYIILKYEREIINRVSFQSPELDYIFSVKQALTNPSWSEDGTITVGTKSFSETTSEKQSFIVDGKSVFVYFGISWSTSDKIRSAPLSVQSTMFFEIEPTSDYVFIYRLWRIAKIFIQYLCYRRDIHLQSADLAAPYDDEKHEKFATLYIIGETDESDAETMDKGRYICQSHIKGCEGKLLSDIASDKLYIHHLPTSYQAGRHIDAARFVMITAAFEWEFHRGYPEGIPKNPERIRIEDTATAAIDDLINASTGELKKKYKFLKKLIKSDSLQNEIEHIGRDLSGLIDLFGNHLYAINDEKLVYSDMGQRLADQRNHFAHGDLEKDFIGLSLLDLVYMEYIVYALQLHYYGVEPQNIRKAVNELFHCRFAL